MRKFRYLKEVATLELDEERCIGCRRCLEVCPHGVFAIRDGRARIIDRDACIECGACARNCPVSTVRVDAGVGCANALIIEWLHEKGLFRNRSCC